MPPIVLEARVKNLIQTEAEWLAEDPVILDGEVAYVRFGNFVNTKAGDGVKRFSQLQYNLEKPAQPVGVLKPSDVPGPANSPRFWFAEKGVYPNVGGLEVSGNAGVIIDNGVSYQVANFEIDLAGYASLIDLQKAEKYSAFVDAKLMDIIPTTDLAGGWQKTSNLPYSNGEAMKLPNGAVSAPSIVYPIHDYFIDKYPIGVRIDIEVLVEHTKSFVPAIDSILFVRKSDGSIVNVATSITDYSDGVKKITSSRVIQAGDTYIDLFYRINSGATAAGDVFIKTLSAKVRVEDVSNPIYDVTKNALSSILITPAYNVDVAAGATAANGVITVPIGQSGSGSTFGFDLIKALPDWKNNFSGKKVALNYVVKAKNITTANLLFRGLYNTVNGNTEIWSNFSSIKFKTEGGFDYYLVSGFLQLPVYSPDITIILAYFVFSNSDTTTLKTIEVFETVIKPFAESFAEIQDYRKKFISQSTLTQSYKLNQRIDVPLLYIQEIGELNGTIAKYVGITENSKRQAFIPAGQTGNSGYIYTNLDKLANCNFLYTNLKGKKITIEVLVKAQGIGINNLTAFCHQNINGFQLETATNRVSEILVNDLQSVYSLKFDITLTEQTITVNPFVQQNGSNTAANRTFEIIGIGIILAYDYDNPKFGMSKAEYKNYVESNILKQETETQRSIKNIVKVKRNGTPGVDCAFSGNRAIQDAIDAIKDASLTNPYRVVAEGHFIATTPAQLDAPSHDNLSFVSSKPCVSLHGVSRQKTVIEVNMPNNLDPGLYSTFQTLLWENDITMLKDLTVIIENGRYAAHIDKASSIDITEKFDNVEFIHRGNTGNAVAWPSPLPLGVGTVSGLQLLFENCKLQALHPDKGTLHGHTNAIFDRPSVMSYKNCRFLSKGKVLGVIRPLGINVEDLFYLEGCGFEGGYTLSISVTDLFPTFTPTLATIPYNVSNSFIKGFGNDPILYKNEITTGYALRIKSKSTGSSSRVQFDENSTAFNLIVKDRDYAGRDYTTDTYEHNVAGYAYKFGDVGFPGYAIGRLDVGEEDARIPAKKLGQRLGDCSTVNKTLTVFIDGVTHNIVFSTNLTSANNSTVLAIINAVIGSVADVDLYSVANDYFAEFTDVLEVCHCSEAIMNGDVVVKEAGLLRKAKPTDFKISGIAIDDFRNGEAGRFIKKGYVSTVNTERFKINMEAYTAVGNGETFGISPTPGKIKTGADQLRFVAIDDNVLSFNL